MQKANDRHRDLSFVSKPQHVEELGFIDNLPSMQVHLDAGLTGMYANWVLEMPQGQSGTFDKLTCAHDNICKLLCREALGCHD